MDEKIFKSLPEKDLKEILELTEAKARLEVREKASELFMPFAHHVYENFIEGRHHRKIAEKLEAVARGEIKRLIINMPPRHKLAINTPIATLDGWKTMGTVRAGDYVFGPDGNPVLVTGKSPVYEKQIYEVETSDGCVIETDDDHLWDVRYRCETSAKFKTLSTLDILKIQENSVSKNWVPKLPRHEPVRYPERKLRVHPYVLGAWLGDGASAQGTMAAHPDDAPHIRKLFEEFGVQTTNTKWNMTFGTKGLMVKLREIGVLGKKHIPEEYLTSSVEQRMWLLRGLIDTDGDVTKEGKVTFNGSNRLLVDQVCEIIHSLGLKARVTTRNTGEFGGYRSAESYRVMFKLDGAASLPRKAQRCRSLSGNYARTISVRKTDRVGKVQCLTVANKDGLFLAGRGYVVTHNSKSEMASYLMPAWFLGRNPKLKIIQATHNTDLAVRFGRKVRDLIDDPHYGEIFPNTKLKDDNKGAGNWQTSAGGEYYAAGVGSAVTGRGADLFIIDDPHSEQDALSETAFEHAYEWYTSGPRQRLQPGASIILVQTRWGKRDLTGRLLAQQASDPLADQWEVVEFPAILPSDEVLWPEFWTKEAMLSIKASLPLPKWSAQWQQQPTSTEAAIVKREWWQMWEKDDLPPVKYIIQAYDTAFSKKETADFSAITTWGIFDEAESGREAIILLDARRGRWNFPELKEIAFSEHNYWEPDMVIVEAKASGRPLIDELQKRGVPALGFSPGRKAGGGGVDKTTRMHLVSPLFESGVVWAPENRRFAEEVIEEIASFPAGDHDDYVDSMTLALMRFRQGGLISIKVDEEDDEELDSIPRAREYY